MSDTAVTERLQQQAAPPHPLMQLRGRLEERRGEIKAALPSDISVDSFIRAVTTGAQLNPDILACSWQSIWKSSLQACRDGLLPDGVEGALVPYKGTCSYLAMYQGLLRRFRRSGQFKWLQAGIVHKGEPFEHWIDQDGEHFKHVPGDDFSTAIEKVYAVALTKDGAFFCTVMTIQECNKIRAMSRATRDDSPWKQWPEEMLKKTAIRRLSKYLPSARDLMPSEFELPEPEAVASLPAPPVGELARASGPAAFLDQFASEGRTHEQLPVESTPSGGGGDVQEEVQTDSSQVQRDESSQETTPAVAADQVQEAYQRGKEAKTNNMLRKAVPGEYRTPAATALAAAWLKGHDGLPL